MELQPAVVAPSHATPAAASRLAPGSFASHVVALASVVAASTLLVLLIARLGAAVGVAWWLPIVVLAAGAVADLASGLVHWAADTWGRESWPVVGPRVLRPFRVHHVNPQDMLGRGFLDLNGDVALLTLPMLATAWLLPVGTSAGQVAAVFFTAWAGWALPTNQVHQWAHHPNPPRLVRWLQRGRAILPAAGHRVHHAAPYATHYCISTGWNNGWTARSGFFVRLERIVTALTGLVPREDEARCADEAPR
jgi:ubiquitin-conjugating enzyme E2 variant